MMGGYGRSGGSKVRLDNVILVSKSGGDFTSVKDAIDSITDNSSINRYTITVGPGVYIIDNTAGPIQLKSFCNISAEGIRSVIFTPQDTTQDMFLGNVFSHLTGIVFSGNTGTSYIVRHTGSGNTFIQDCVLRDCANGFILNSSAASFEIRVLAINNIGVIDTVNGIVIEAGSAILDGIVFRPTAIVGTGIKISGSNSIVSIHNITSSSPNITTSIECFDGCQVIGSSIDISLCSDGLLVYGNNTLVHINASRILNCSNDGFRIDNTGIGIEVILSSMAIINSGNLNFNILNPNSTTLGSGYSELDKAFMVAGAQVNVSIIDIVEGDEGTNIFGELHVGNPINPTESAFGGGDSYTAGMIVYTETTGNVFTDVSIAARSVNGSTFTFPGIAVNNAIYIASTLNNGSDFLEHYGIKDLVSIAAVKGTGSIIAEYWDGAAWVEIEAMEVESSGQYFPHANDYFSNIGSHQIRYNSALVTDSWTKNDPILPALGISYYWMRFRIDSAITTAPIFEQFKLHTNRSEINSDGWLEYFGKARPIGQLGLNFSSARPFEGNMQSQTIYINEDVGVGFTQNKFTASGDKTGISGFLPFDFDTSSPLKLQWSGMPSISQTIVWTIRVDWVTDNGSDLYFTTEPVLSPGRKVVTVSKAITADEVSMFEALIDVKEMLSRRDGAFGDEIWVSMQPSTISGTFTLVSSQATYTKWCEGGHV